MAKVFRFETQGIEMIRAVRKCCKTLAFAVTFLAGCASHAQPYPSQMVTLVLPYSAGTGIDGATRAIAEKLRERLGHPFIVLNKVGAAGNIGTDFVAKAAPDGNTILIVANTLAMNPSLYKNLPYDPIKDFESVGMMLKGAMVLVAAQALPAQNLAEFMNLARDRPGRLNYASTGIGTPQHLAMELLKSTANLDLMHVPHRGAAEALTSVMGGQVEVMFVPIQSALGAINAGKLKALAVSSPERNPLLPNVPSIAATLGTPFDVDLWYGMFVPQGTPASITGKLNAEVRDILAMPDISATLKAQGLAAAPSTPQELTRLVTADIGRWAKVIKAGGISAD